MLHTGAAAALRTLDRAAIRSRLGIAPGDRKLIKRCADVLVYELRGEPAGSVAPILFLTGRRIGRSHVIDYLAWRSQHADYAAAG